MLNKIDYFCHPNRFPQVHDILCSRQLILEERFDIPCDKPDIQNLVSSRIDPVIEHYQFLDSVRGKKVFIKGRLDQEILYVADSFCEPVHALHNSYSFSTYLDLCECAVTPLLEAYAPRVLVEFAQTWQICPRSIGKSIILFIWYPHLYLPPPVPQTSHIIHQRSECREVCRPRVRKPKHTRVYYEE